MDEGHHLYSSLVSIIQKWWLGTIIHTHSDCEYVTQADRVTESNMSLRSFEHRHCDWLNHTTWFHSNQFSHSVAPKLGIWVNIASFLYTIQTGKCYVGCLMIANTWTYISLYISNTAIVENKTSDCIFSASTCEHLWPSPSHLVNCAKCSHNPSKDAADWSVVTDLKSLLNFKVIFLKI